MPLFRVSGISRLRTPPRPRVMAREMTTAKVLARPKRVRKYIKDNMAQYRPKEIIKRKATAAVERMYEPLFEMDEVSIVQRPDRGSDVEFITSGFHPNSVGLKARVLIGLEAPYQRTKKVKVEEVQKGIIVNRYRVNAETSPLLAKYRDFGISSRART